MKGRCDICGNAESNHRMIGGHDYTEIEKPTVELTAVIPELEGDELIQIGAGLYRYDHIRDINTEPKLIFIHVGLIDDYVTKMLINKEKN